MKKILQEAQVCLNHTQEHKTQTADNTIFYLAKGFEGLYLEQARSQAYASTQVLPHRLQKKKIKIEIRRKNEKEREREPSKLNQL